MLGMGIVVGLGAVLFQDCGYIASRIYMKRQNNATELLLFTQFLMGVAGVGLLAFFWDTPAVAGGRFWLPLAGTALGSLGGQFCFFMAERRIAPSRLAALMGLRVVSVALVTALFMGAVYNAWQYVAIAFAALSAGVMNYKSGGGFKWEGMQWVGGSLAFYCCSDLSIFALIHALPTGNIFHSAVIAMALVNVTLLLVALGCWGWLRYPVRDAAPVMPFAGLWLAKQFLLYGCFALTGAVYGNVIMALRGPVAVILGIVLVRLHWSEGQPPLSFAEWVRRGAATVMMASAIILYTLE